MTTDISGNSYKILVNGIGSVLERGRDKAIIKVNSILVETYWHVGQRIVEFEQAGKIKAEYGKELLLRLSKDLRTRYGKGFSRSNLQYMRLLYMAYPKRQTLSGKLSWSHYVELLSISDDAGRSFYEKQLIPGTRNKHIQNPEIKSGALKFSDSNHWETQGSLWQDSIFSAGLTAWVDQDTEVNLFYLEQNDGH